MSPQAGIACEAPALGGALILVYPHDTPAPRLCTMIESPPVRVLAVPDSLTLARFDEIFCTMLGWEGLGYSSHIYGKEFASFLRRSTMHRETLGGFSSAVS